MRKKKKPTVYGRAFGTTIRYFRLEAGFAQETLALEAGIGRAYMSAMERGLHNPTFEMLYRMLPLLNVSFEEFAREYDVNLRRAKRGN